MNYSMKGASDMGAININPEFFRHDAQAGGFFPKTHSNPGLDIKKFISKSGQNYLIEGIRGTGKTHILKMITEICLEEYSELKVLPVYVSLASVSEWIERDIKLFRIHFYAHIVQSAVLTIEDNKSKIELAGNSVAVKAIKKIAQMFGLNDSENIDIVLNKIKDINQELIHKLTYSPEEFSTSSGVSSKMTGKAGLGNDTVSLGVEGSIEESNNQNVKYVGNSLSSENAASFIVHFLSELKSILEHEYTYILIDECSEVSHDAQVEVFRLLKLIRGGFSKALSKNPAYFCATVYPSPMTYYPSKIKGDSFNFECGHDAIMEHIILDELSDEYLDFFRELTNKRILELVTSDATIEDYNDMFENEKAFVLAAYFANGNVRRYIEILKHSYDKLCIRVNNDGESSNKKKITSKDVEECISTIVNTQIISMNNLLEKDLDVLDTLISKITKRNKKNETENAGKTTENKLPSNVYFTVSRGESVKLGNLIMQGALHDKNKTRLKKYYKEGGTRGALLMLDLAVAFNDSAILRTRAQEIFTKDLKANAKSGYLWCQDFKID